MCTPLWGRALSELLETCLGNTLRGMTLSYFEAADEILLTRITSRIFRTFFWGSLGQVLLCLKSGHHGRLSRTRGPNVYPGFGN